MNEKARLAIHEKLYRIVQPDGQLTETHSEPVKSLSMITRVTTRPNPFLTAVTLDVACDQSKHVIVRMFDAEDKIVKMFGWFLVKGINVTTINEMSGLQSGPYQLDIVDREGSVLYTT